MKYHLDIIDELRQTAGRLINGTIEDGEVAVGMLSEAADEIERLRSQAQIASSQAEEIKRLAAICNAYAEKIEALSAALRATPATAD